MSKPIEVFLDNCIFGHSIREIPSLGPEGEWLKDQILAINQIIKLWKQDKIKIGFDLNIFIEGRRRRSSDNKKIEQKWGTLKPGPTFVDFQGVMVNRSESEKKEWKQRLSELQKWLGDKSLDVTHLLQAELYQAEFFITTDKKLINKAGNARERFLRVEVVSPKEFVEIFRRTFPDR